MLLTSYLYIDYGDAFAGGSLQGADVTAGALLSHTAADGININGPRLHGPDGKYYAGDTSLILNSFGDFFGASAAAMRRTIDALVRRAYEPLDVVVIDLTPVGTTVNGKTVAAAAGFDDVSRTLAASGGGGDSYVFVAQAIIGGTTADKDHDPLQFEKHGYGGIASGLDFNGVVSGDNLNQGTALALLGSGAGINFIAQTIAHEAGHLLGLTHTWRTDANDPDSPRESVGDYRAQLDLYSSSDTMSYLSDSGFTLFSRLPQVADQKPNSDGDAEDNTDTSFLNAAPTPYDHLIAAGSGVGASGIEYVTGSGANDIISIVKTGPTSARVTVQTFTDEDHTDPILIPGKTVSTFTYDIQTDRPLVIDGGLGRDRFVMDGDLGTTITVRADSYSGDPAGASKADELVILGKGAASGVYTPGTNDENSAAGGADLRGTVTIGATTIQFQEFSILSSVTVSDVTNFRYATPVPPPGTDGDYLSIDSSTAGQNKIEGGFWIGASFVPFIWHDVANFTIDTATNGGASDDSITLYSSLVAAGLRNFTILTGAGDDVVTTYGGFALPVAGGAFVYNAGAGTADKLVVSASGTSVGGFSPDGSSAFAGTFTQDGADLATLGLEFAEVSEFASFLLTTPNDSDEMIITPDLTGPGENKVAGSSGGVAFSTLSFYDVGDFLIDAASNQISALVGDAFTIQNPGGAALQASSLKNFTIRSGPGDDVLTVNAADFRLPVAGGRFVFNGGTGGSNLRGLISLDRIVVDADVDYDLSDVGPRGTDDTAAEGLLAIAPAGSGAATSALLGSINLIGVEAATLVGGASNNRMDGSRFSGGLVLRGLGGNDTLIGGWGDNMLEGGDGNDLLIAGDDRFAKPGLGSQNHVILGGGGTNLLDGGAGDDVFQVALAGTATLIGGAGDDTFQVLNAGGLVTAPVGGITVDGGGQAGDRLVISGGGGPTFNEYYILGPADAGQIVTTNNYNTNGPTISQFIRYTRLAAIDDSATVASLHVVAASADAPIGGASAFDLAAGRMNLTIGGAPAPAIRFMNKSRPSILLADGIVVTPDDVVLYPIPMPAPMPMPMPVVNPAPAPVPAVATAIQPSAEGLVAGPIAPAAAAEAAAAATEDVPAPVHVAGRGRRLAASRASTRAVAGRVGVSTSAHAAATRALAARKPPTFALRAAFHRTGAGRMIMPLRRA